MDCEGACEVRNNGHFGTVRTVTVEGHGHGPFDWNYCQQAIDEDRANGFVVKEQEEK